MAEETFQPNPIPSTPASGPSRTRVFILTVGVVIIFLLAYLLAWWSAYRLTQGYMDDADASYEEGRYLDALVGYEKYSPSKREYIEYGGYMQVQRIWSNDYAWPKPDAPAQAKQRVDEIIQQRLTLEDAELFVQENIGRSNPYMGMIYLRLGELYEADGRLRDAEDIYASIPDLFPNDADLIERARVDLENLQQ